LFRVDVLPSVRFYAFLGRIESHALITYVLLYNNRYNKLQNVPIGHSYHEGWKRHGIKKLFNNGLCRYSLSVNA
jgi:hypothetical protein